MKKLLLITVLLTACAEPDISHIPISYIPLPKEPPKALYKGVPSEIIEQKEWVWCPAPYEDYQCAK